MKNVKYRGKKKNSAVNSAAQNPRQKPKFRGSARNSAVRGKLWALHMCFAGIAFHAVVAMQLYIEKLTQRM